MDAYIKAIMTLLAGLGTFLVGVKLLSDNLEKLATNNIRKLFKKTSNNRIAGVGIGFVTTGIVQSSGLTTVMVVGLVNAGIMTLFQATTVIMGANIGTTVTAWLAAAGVSSFTQYFFLLAVIGVFMEMFSKNEKVKCWGLIIAGLGLVFFGLKNMSSGFELLDASNAANGAIAEFISSITNPFLLLFIGIIFTTITQSSSAITSILISMAAGANMQFGGGGNAVLYIILGTNIGSTTTALMSSIGASPNARRASLIHLLFNFFGSIIFFIFFSCWPGFMDATFGSWLPSVELQIATFHTVFNVICTIMFLPFAQYFVKLANLLIKDKKADEVDYLDKRLLSSPALAIDASDKALVVVLEKAVDVLDASLQAFIDKDVSQEQEIEKMVDGVNERARKITDYLVKVSSGAGTDVNIEKTITDLHNSIGDAIRIAELGHNLTKYTKRTVKQELNFSCNVVTGLGEYKELVHSLYDTVIEFISTKNAECISKATEIEESIDAMRRRLVNEHIERLNNGDCRAESSSVYINLVNNIERIGDHLSRIVTGTN